MSELLLISIAYQGSFQPYTKDDRHYVKVYTLDNDVNQNDWGVTPEARARSMGTFFEHPLLGPKHLSSEHVVDADPTHPHYGEWAKIGRPVDFESNGATYGIYEVTVDQAWDLIQAGKLNAVSPSLTIKNSTRTRDGKEIVTDFAWDHVLFVDHGAIPEAGVVGTCTAPDPCLCTFGEAVQAALKTLDTNLQGSEVQERLRQAMFGYRRDWSQIDPVTGLGRKVEDGNDLQGGGIFQELLRSEQFGYARNAQGRMCTLESLFPQQQIAQASKRLFGRGVG